MNVTNSYSRKSRWKNRVICLFPMFCSWVMVIKLSKKWPFLQFCADLGKKSKSIKAIYIHASERSRFALDMVYRSLSHRSWDISDYNINKDTESAEISENSLTSNPNISKVVSHSIINNTIFWKYATGPF